MAEAEQSLQTNADKSLPQKPADIPSALPERNKLNSAEYLRTAQAFGSFYSSFINNLCGREEMNTQAFSSLDAPVRARADALMKGVQSGREVLQIQTDLRQMDAHAFLTQVIVPESAEELLSDTSKYRLESLSRGIFAVHMDFELFQRITGGGPQAIAFMRPRGGVSFILIREIKDSRNEDNLRENMPHETNHVAMDLLQQEQLRVTNEASEEERKAFLMYQEELICKLCSDGYVISNTHLKYYRPEALQKLEAEQPNIISEIRQRQLSLNELLERTEAQRNQTDVRKEDFILPVWEATTFEEMETNLTNMQGIVEQQPVTKERLVIENNNGWGWYAT